MADEDIEQTPGATSRPAAPAAGSAPWSLPASARPPVPGSSGAPLRPIPGAPPIDPTSGQVTQDQVNAATGTLPAHVQDGPSDKPLPTGAEESVSLRDTLVAAYKQGDPIYNIWNRYVLHPDIEAPAPPGYDALNDIKGYEQNAVEFIHSTNPAQTQRIKDLLDAENDVNRTVEQSGTAGIASSLALSVFAPTSIAMLAIPGMEAFGVASRVGKVVGGMALNVGLGEAQQGVLAATRETTDYEDGIGWRIGINAVLAGTLGTMLTRFPKTEFDNLRTAADAGMTFDGKFYSVAGRDAGAAFTRETTLLQESIRAGGRAITWLDAHLGPLASPTSTVFTESTEPEVRRVYQRLTSLGNMQLVKNTAEGGNLATSNSVEMAVNRAQHIAEAQTIINSDDNFKDYHDRGGKLTRTEFNEAVTDAANNSDQHEIPEVAKVAKFQRTMYDEHRKELQALGVFGPGDLDLLGAPSYSPYVWDQGAILNDREGFRQMAIAHFMKDPRTEPVVGGTPKTTEPSTTFYHSSPAKFDKFDHSKIGTGEGNQSFSHGIYGAESPDVARSYDKISEDRGTQSYLYQFEVANKDLEGTLDWDKPLSEQPRIMKALGVKALKEGETVPLNGIDPSWTGQQLHDNLLKGKTNLGAPTKDKAALAAWLEKKGVTGVSYLDGASRGAGEGTRNVVLYKKTEGVITHRNGESIEPAIREKMQDNAKAHETVTHALEGENTPEQTAALQARLKVLEREGKALERQHAAATTAKPGEVGDTAVGPPKAEWMKNGTVLEPGEREAIAADKADKLLDRIQNVTQGNADLPITGGPSPLKERTLNIPWEDRKAWSVRDNEQIVRSYLRTMVPHLEMLREFGSTDLAKERADIASRYSTRLAAAGSDTKASKALTAERNKMLNIIELQRDRILNRAGPKGDVPRGLVRSAQLIRSINYVRTLGGQVFSAIPDWGRAVGQYGLANTAGRTADFIMSSELRNLSMEDANKMGTAWDNLLHTRMHSIEGIGDDSTGSMLGRIAQRETARFTRFSGIAAWDTGMRVLTSQLEQDALHRIITGTASAFERAQMAAHGIGADDIAAIAKEWNKWGSNEGGLNRARTELWENQDAARKVESAVQSAASSTAFYVGKGDMPAFADKQYGKFLLQFKGFVMSSVSRLVVPTAQGLAAGELKAANGVAIMLALGGMRYYLKEKAAGREPDMTPKNFGLEMLQGSGLLAFLPDLYDPIAGAMNLPRFSKFQNHSPWETALGSTGGTLANVMQAAYHAAGGHMSAQDMHRIRQLLPYNNMFYLNRAFNLLEGKTEDALDLKGAPHRDAADYFNPSKDTVWQDRPESKEHFGGIQSIPNHF